MKTLPQPLEFKDNREALCFLPKRRNDCPLVIEIDTKTEDIRYLRVSYQGIDDLIKHLQDIRDARP